MWSAVVCTPIVPLVNYQGEPLGIAFMHSIFRLMDQFPTGPKIDDPFWLQLIIWHFGLFTVLTLGTIGVQGKKQNYCKSTSMPCFCLESCKQQHFANVANQTNQTKPNRVKNAFCFETHFGLGLEKILQTYKTSNSISVFCVSLNIYIHTKQFIHAPVVSLLRSSRLSAVELILSSPLAVINPTTIKSRGCTPSPRISRLIL